MSGRLAGVALRKPQVSKHRCTVFSKLFMLDNYSSISLSYIDKRFLLLCFRVCTFWGCPKRVDELVFQGFPNSKNAQTPYSGSAKACLYQGTGTSCDSVRLQPLYNNAPQPPPGPLQIRCH